jgi:hypothetical protein
MSQGRAGWSSGDLGRADAEEVVKEATTGTATIDLLNEYCKSYLVERQGHTEEEATAILQDPKLGRRMDRLVEKWLRMDFEDGVRPDEFLLTKRYDSPQMDRVNRLLDQLDYDSARREPKTEQPPSTLTRRIPTSAAVKFGWQTVKRNHEFVVPVMIFLLAVGVCEVFVTEVVRDSIGLSAKSSRRHTGTGEPLPRI